MAIWRVWSCRLSNLTLRGKHFVASVLNLEYEVTEHWSVSQNFIRWDSVQKVCKFYGPSSHELPIRVWENTGGVFRITWPGGQPMRRQQGRARCGASSGHSSVSRAADYHGVRPDTGNNTVTSDHHHSPVWWPVTSDVTVKAPSHQSSLSLPSVIREQKSIRSPAKSCLLLLWNPRSCCCSLARDVSSYDCPLLGTVRAVRAVRAVRVNKCDHPVATKWSSSKMSWCQSALIFLY